MMKPLVVDLRAQCLTIKGETDAAMAQVIAQSSSIRGRHLDQFERRWIEPLGAKRCASCANGTDALYLGMKALGLKEGDEVVTTALSWISTSETITQAGGRVVCADTNFETFTIDPANLEPEMVPRTKGVLVVHLNEQSADIDPILDIRRRRGVWLIEGRAQAHLALYKSRLVGTVRAVGTISLYAGKHLGPMGDAGCAVTNDSAVATPEAMSALHGWLAKNDDVIEGINSRLDGLQAAPSLWNRVQPLP